MKRTTVLLTAAALAAALTAPAMAAFVRLGSVDVGFRNDSDTAYTRFGGRLESLRLTASRSDIVCRSVVVRYDNGEVQNVFSGRLDERRPTDVDLRGRARRVDSIRFACRSDEARGGRIYIDGEAGRYMDEWRRDRDWDRVWSGLFGGMMGPGGPGDMRDHGPHGMDRDGMDRDGRGPGGMMGPGAHGNGPGPMMGPGRDWISLGRVSFEGKNDKENTFGGWGARHIDSIALRPLDGDARCMSLVATFDGGHKVKLADGRVLERGRMTSYDLPGRERNLSKLYMRCRALDGYSVTVEIFAHR
jgi:hypothetical protein